MIEYTTTIYMKVIYFYENRGCKLIDFGLMTLEESESSVRQYSPYSPDLENLYYLIIKVCEMGLYNEKINGQCPFCNPDTYEDDHVYTSVQFKFEKMIEDIRNYLELVYIRWFIGKKIWKEIL